MAGMYFSFVLISWTASSLASVIPAQTETQPQEYMRMDYARPVMRAAPVMPVHHVPHTYQRFYNPYQRRPLTPAPPRPESERFSPSIGTGTVWPQAGTGTISTDKKPSTGLSYINNLLTGVSKKTYGPARGTSNPVGGTQTPTSGQPGTSSGTNWGIPSGTGLETPVVDPGTDLLGTPTGTGFGTPAINPDPTGTGLGPATGTGLGTLPLGVGLGDTGSSFGPSNPGSGSGTAGTGLGPTDLNSDLVLNTGTGLGSNLNAGTGIGNGGPGFDAGTDFGNTGAGLGGTGSGGFPGGSGSPAADLFGPGLSPVALDLTDPSGDGSSPGMTANGSPGVIINNGPNQPSTSIFSDGSPTSTTSTSTSSTITSSTTTSTGGTQSQSQPGELDPRFPSQRTQSDTWVWPDLVITGALPSTQFGEGSQ